MILAVDTSCYTTSLTVVEVETGNILYEFIELLNVKQGAKGLRQSDGFFQHCHALNKAFKMFCQEIDVQHIKAVAVSNKPRNIDGSYMPVFNAGVLFCENLSMTLKVPLYAFSHQEGHVMAAVKTSTLEYMPSFFYAMHLSGGTTELLKVHVKEDDLKTEMVGESLDIHFGQLVDRIGVKLGCPFPAGKYLDELAKTSDCQSFYKTLPKKGTHWNLSGLENKYEDLMRVESKENVSKHLFNTIGKIIDVWIKQVDDGAPLVISGGVASNSHIRSFLNNQSYLGKLYFAQPKYSQDNALGIAALGRNRYIKEQAID